VFSNQIIFTSYSHGHDFEEEVGIHDEPYGYEVGDDPFDPQGHGDYPYMILYVAAVSFAHFMYSHMRFDRRKIGEVLYHQRLTAFQLEDEIKRLRR
jgi:hypothetical protein